MGDIDLVTAAGLEAMIIEALAEPPAGGLVVDLSRVEFMDSSGLRILVRGRRLAGERGVRFSVTGATGIVRQVLDLTGLSAHLAPSSD